MSSIRVPFPHRVKQHPKESPAIVSGFFVGGVCVRSQGGPRESLDTPGRRWGGYGKHRQPARASSYPTGARREGDQLRLVQQGASGR